MRRNCIFVFLYIVTFPGRLSGVFVWVRMGWWYKLLLFTSVTLNKNFHPHFSYCKISNKHLIDLLNNKMGIEQLTWSKYGLLKKGMSQMLDTYSSGDLLTWSSRQLGLNFLSYKGLTLQGFFLRNLFFIPISFSGLLVSYKSWVHIHIYKPFPKESFFSAAVSK